MTHSSFLRRLASNGPQAEAWGELCERYGGWISNWCRRWGASESDAEDLTQETLLRVYQHIQGYRHQGPLSFRSWMRVIARTMWLMLIRYRSRRPVLESISEREEVLIYEEISAEAVRLEEREILEIVFQRVRERVSAESWRAFELSTLGGYGAEAVAGMLGGSRSRVHMANSRIRRLLREELEMLEAGGKCHG
jgi:RNA polymerase sigma-70 factor (ECF subfamily)